MTAPAKKSSPKSRLGKVFASVALVYAGTMGAMGLSGCKLEDLKNYLPKIDTTQTTDSTQVVPPAVDTTTPPPANTNTPPAVPTVPKTLDQLIEEADATNGATLAKFCGACHTFNQGGGTVLGPNLYGVVGRARGGVAGYTYSPGMLAKSGTWTEANLNDFLQHPTTAVPGTKMPYAGMTKAEDRAAVIKYLRTLK